MYSYLIIGMTGQGKSKMAHKMISNEKSCLVFDVNNEYGVHPDNENWSMLLPTNVSLPRCRYVGGDMKEFMNIVKTKRYCNVVFEEASGFFRGAIGADLVKMIINKRHTHNNYIFIFHSIASVPPSILQYVNFITLFQTADSPKRIKDRDDRLVPYYSSLQGKPKGTCINIEWMPQ